MLENETALILRDVTSQERRAFVLVSEDFMRIFWSVNDGLLCLPISLGSSQ